MTIDEKFVKDPDHPIEVTDQDLDKAVQAYPNLVVDCWAQWCGPCKMLGPILENLAKKHKGEIVFAKLDVDQNPETARKFGIRSIPNLIVFKNGTKMGDIVGAMPEARLMERIRALLG
ncbi:MAG TPA: thioredoxin [Deltaproteobacteria bacterium]|nr:thioredoxin [Deltaproteobacteria bacterium]